MSLANCYIPLTKSNSIISAYENDSKSGITRTHLSRIASSGFVVDNPTTVIPAALPACRPWKESSNTTQFSGWVPNTSAPNRKQSGAGLE